LLWRDVLSSSSDQSHGYVGDANVLLRFAHYRLVGMCQHFCKTQKNVVIIIIVVVVVIVIIIMIIIITIIIILTIVKTPDLTWK
jgi:hypothetical protein